MVAPVVESTSSGNSAGATSHTANYPSGVSSGDLLVLHVCADGTPTITVSDFTQIDVQAHTGSTINSYVGYRDATGSEGSTFTIGSSASESISYEVFRISGAEDPATQAPESEFFNSSGNVTDLDCPSITPTGGSKDYQILTFCGFDTGNRTITGFPYTNNNIDEGGGNTGNDTTTGAANDAVTAATIDPGNFTNDAARPGTSWTIAVHPTGSAVTGTGALASQAATLAGTGEIEKTATGALSSQAATVAGTGLIEKTATGALNSQAATIAGTGAVSGAVTGTGALNADAATVSGAGLIEKTATGALSADAATLAGTGAIERKATGALSAQAATVAGTGAVGNVITGTGVITDDPATITGAGLIEKTASGTLSAQSATMTGAGVMARDATGALSPGAATLAGTGAIERTASGVLSAQAASLAGTGNVSSVAQNYEVIAFSLNISRSRAFNLGIFRSWP